MLFIMWFTQLLEQLNHIMSVNRIMSVYLCRVHRGNRIKISLTFSLVSFQESPSGRRKALATSCINMKQYASAMPTQTDVKLKFKPLSKKVVSATLQFSLSCIFLREGKAT